MFEKKCKQIHHMYVSLIDQKIIFFNPTKHTINQYLSNSVTVNTYVIVAKFFLYLINERARN